MLSPEFLDAEENIDLVATSSLDLNPQYRIIRSGPNSNGSRKRAVKQKPAKPKAKAKPMIKSKAVPAAVSHPLLRPVLGGLSGLVGGHSLGKNI